MSLFSRNQSLCLIGGAVSHVFFFACLLAGLIHRESYFAYILLNALLLVASGINRSTKPVSSESEVKDTPKLRYELAFLGCTGVIAPFNYGMGLGRAFSPNEPQATLVQIFGILIAILAMVFCTRVTITRRTSKRAELLDFYRMFLFAPLSLSLLLLKAAVINKGSNY